MVELGGLELGVLAAIRSIGEGSPGEIHREVRKTRDVAYTSVTTTLYRLVDKGLVAARRESEKRVYYRIHQGRAYRKALEGMVDRIVDSFGEAAVSYLIERPGGLTPEQRSDLAARIADRRKGE